MADEQTDHVCQCGARIRVERLVSSGSVAPDPLSGFLVHNELRITRRFAHEGSGIVDECNKRLQALKDEISKQDLAALRDLEHLFASDESESADGPVRTSKS